VTLLGQSVLRDEFNRLKSNPDAQRRGYALEQLLVQAFRKAHFKVEHNPGTATPRQTDLTATYGGDRYLIEAKWESEPLDTGHIDDMRLARLGRTEGTVVGVIFSVSGFRDSARREVTARRERSVLLFGDAELERILADPKELLRLLRVKRDELVIHGRAHLEAPEWPRRRAPRASHDLPGTGVCLLDGNRQPVPYMTSRGRFGQFASRPSHFRSTEEVTSKLFDSLRTVHHGRVYLLEPFTEEQQRAFLARWFELRGDADPHGEARRWMDAVAGVDNLPELAKTPRMLTFMVEDLALDEIRKAAGGGAVTAAACISAWSTTGSVPKSKGSTRRTSGRWGPTSGNSCWRTSPWSCCAPANAT
jgi:Restriction endonuclease